MTEKIFLTPINLSAQFIKTINKEHCFIEIHDKYLIVSFDYTAEEPKDLNDKELGLEIKRTCFLVTILKEKISGIELSITQSGKRWVVSIMPTGFASDIQFFFKSQSEGFPLRNKLHEWLIK